METSAYKKDSCRNFTILHDGFSIFDFWCDDEFLAHIQDLVAEYSTTEDYYSF